jgi:hypothetical protein
MTQNKKLDNFKLASGVFTDFKNTLLQVLKTNPEIVEDAIRKRNTQIKCLKADIEHRQVVFKEISERYENVITENENLKLSVDTLKRAYEVEKEEKNKFALSSSNSHKLFTQKQNDYINLKRDYNLLEKDYIELKEELEKSKTHIAIEINERKKTLYYRLNVIADKIPNDFLKSIVKFFISKQIINYTTFLIFVFLLVTSIYGWTPVIEFIKQIANIF